MKQLQNKLKEKDEVIESLQYDLQWRSKLAEAMNSGTRKFLQEEIDKFNREFSMDKPLDIDELEDIVGEIHYEPCKYPQIVKLLRDAVLSANRCNQPSQTNY